MASPVLARPECTPVGVSAPTLLPTALLDGLNRRSLPSLNGIRGISALMVVAFHLDLPLPGKLGVLIFFVLSGFLITWLMLHEEARWGDISLRHFYIRRSLRLLPTFYVYWFLAGLVVPLLIAKPIYWPQVWAAALYVTNYYHAFAENPSAILSHTWSLAVEEQFYLLWPMLFIALRSCRRQFLLWAVPVLWAWRWTLAATGANETYLYEAFDARADHLLVGCLLAVLLYEQRWQRVWAFLVGQPVALWITMVLLAASSSYQDGSYRNYVGYCIEPVLACALIVQAVSFSQSSARWMNALPLSWAGKLSYSIYLYHPLALIVAKKLAHGQHWSVVAVIGIAASIAVAAVPYCLIEQPFIRLKDRLGSRRADMKPLAVAA